MTLYTATLHRDPGRQACKAQLQVVPSHHESFSKLVLLVLLVLLELLVVLLVLYTTSSSSTSSTSSNIGILCVAIML